LKKNNIKRFKIPVSYEVSGEIIVEAKTAKEALEYAEENLEIFELPSIYDVDYIDGSFQINADLELVELMNERNKI
jgi:hypothetical protein